MELDMHLRPGFRKKLAKECEGGLLTSSGCEPDPKHNGFAHNLKQWASELFEQNSLSWLRKVAGLFQYSYGFLTI
jgi:hypothetical protein